MAKELDNCKIINVPDLNIHPCEGNVSREDGNRCGIKDALLKDKKAGIIAGEYVKQNTGATKLIIKEIC
jgi:multimeric flavodoxin WrbA